MFFSGAAVIKCSSISAPPPKNSKNLSKPILRAMLTPMADHTEYRPPTQSQISKILFSGIPNCKAAALLAVTAYKWEVCNSWHIPFFLYLLVNNSFMSNAFCLVSVVENVFDAIINSVFSISMESRVETKDSSSTFEIK